MILAALALTLLSPVQADWPYFGGTAPGDTGLSVDPGSIKRDGDNRIFAGRMLRKGEDQRHIEVTLRADCKLRALFVTHARAFDGDKLVDEREEPGGGQMIDDGSATVQVVDFVCAK